MDIRQNSNGLRHTTSLSASHAHPTADHLTRRFGSQSSRSRRTRRLPLAKTWSRETTRTAVTMTVKDRFLAARCCADRDHLPKGALALPFYGLMATVICTSPPNVADCLWRGSTHAIEKYPARIDESVRRDLAY